MVLDDVMLTIPAKLYVIVSPSRVTLAPTMRRALSMIVPDNPVNCVAAAELLYRTIGMIAGIFPSVAAVLTPMPMTFHLCNPVMVIDPSRRFPVHRIALPAESKAPRGAVLMLLSAGSPPTRSVPI